VLRRYHDSQRLASDPWYVPANEALALRLVADAGVPAPRLHAADLEGEFCETPALLESWIAGEPAWRPKDLDAFLRHSAETLVQIHAIRPADARLLRYVPYREPGPMISPPFTTRPGLWERVARVLERPAPEHRETFIHRDYHQGNVLWDGGGVTGVVDWATAAWGPPGIDVARMRLNLAWHLDGEAADRFLAAYSAAGGEDSTRHAYWDLLDAADLLSDLDRATARHAGFARFERWVAGVLEECAAPPRPSTASA
jgi:aminoglycoside phosphotransferase (APT) family kinase protein